jgi:hypothetical protein
MENWALREPPPPLPQISSRPSPINARAKRLQDPTATQDRTDCRDNQDNLAILVRTELQATTETGVRLDHPDDQDLQADQDQTDVQVPKIRDQMDQLDRQAKPADQETLEDRDHRDRMATMADRDLPDNRVSPDNLDNQAVLETQEPKESGVRKGRKDRATTAHRPDSPLVISNNKPTSRAKEFRQQFGFISILFFSFTKTDFLTLPAFLLPTVVLS